MDAVRQYVDCPECEQRMILGEAFPCGKRYDTPEKLQENCKVIGKPWQTEEFSRPDGVIPINGPQDTSWAHLAEKAPHQFSHTITTEDMPSQAHSLRPKLTGGSAEYYKLPNGASELQDLIEHKGMSFGRGNIFKAMYRLGEKDAATEEYDLEKTVWFAIRRINELRIEYGKVPREMPSWLS